MANNKRIGIIGAGNMGMAIIAGLRKKYTLRVCEKSKRQQRFLKNKYKLSTVDLETLCKRSDVIILAVKPQSFSSVLKALKGYLNKDHLIVSIAAGITTAFLEKKLGKEARVVRVMPNLPAQIGMSMTGVCKGKKASGDDARFVVRMFQHIGLTMKVKEEMMDALTAVSGSGPAYLFYFAECFIEAARKLGFKKKEAADLVLQTLNGSLNLLETSTDDAATLRKKVTSKGGTTEAAFKEFHKRTLEVTMRKALKAAAKRSKELSK